MWCVWACSEILKSPILMPPTARPALLLSFTESPGTDSPSPSQTLTLLLLFSLFPETNSVQERVISNQNFKATFDRSALILSLDNFKTTYSMFLTVREVGDPVEVQCSDWWWGSL